MELSKRLMSEETNFGTRLKESLSGAASSSVVLHTMAFSPATTANESLEDQTHTESIRKG